MSLCKDRKYEIWLGLFGRFLNLLTELQTRFYLITSKTVKA
jgi:hypothetical protein